MIQKINIFKSLVSLALLTGFLLSYAPSLVVSVHQHEHEHEHEHHDEDHCEILDACHIQMHHDATEGSCDHEQHLTDEFEVCSICNLEFVQLDQTESKTLEGEQKIPSVNKKVLVYEEQHTRSAFDETSARGPPSIG